MKEIKWSDLRKLCFCNSKELNGKTYAYGGKSHEWVGIGMIEKGPQKKLTSLSSRGEP